MSRKRESESREKILALFDGYQKVDQSTIAEKTGLSYPTVIKHLKELKEHKVIICVRTEGSRRKGKPKNILVLERKGASFLNTVADLPFNKFVDNLTEQIDLTKLNRIIERWRLEETPNLARYMIQRNHHQLYNGSFDEDRLEKDVAELLMNFLFWKDFDDEDSSDNKYRSVYAQNRVDPSITPDDPKLREEASLFLRNNPWMRKAILSCIDDWLGATRHEVDFWTNIRVKGEKL